MRFQTEVPNSLLSSGGIFFYLMGASVSCFHSQYNGHCKRKKKTGHGKGHGNLPLLSGIFQPLDLVSTIGVGGVCTQNSCQFSHRLVSHPVCLWLSTPSVPCSLTQNLSMLKWLLKMQIIKTLIALLWHLALRFIQEIKCYMEAAIQLSVFVVAIQVFKKRLELYYIILCYLQQLFTDI